MGCLRGNTYGSIRRTHQAELLLVCKRYIVVGIRKKNAAPSEAYEDTYEDIVVRRGTNINSGMRILDKTQGNRGKN